MNGTVREPKLCQRGHSDWYPNGRCRQCAKDRATKWAADNAEKRRDIANAYYSRNKDKYAEVRCDRWNAWYYGNHEKNKLSRRVRQAARKSNYSGRFTVEDVSNIRALQKDKCAACSVDLSGGGQADHIVPVSKGGPNIPSNIQLLCAFCNQSKKDKDPIDFMQSLGRLL
jgi:5-methylcytosine-specific restriction endonuclease McrA